MKIYGRGKVGRNVTISKCIGVKRIRGEDDEDKIEDFSFFAYGNYVPIRATRFARRIFNDKTIIINSVNTYTTYYSMPIDLFMRYAERNDKNDGEQ